MVSRRASGDTRLGRQARLRNNIIQRRGYVMVDMLRNRYGPNSRIIGSTIRRPNLSAQRERSLQYRIGSTTLQNSARRIQGIYRRYRTHMINRASGATARYMPFRLRSRQLS